MNATGSKAFTVIYMLLVAFLFTYGSRGCELTAARLAMSIGRDKGLPFPRQFQTIVNGQPILGLTVAGVAAALFGKQKGHGDRLHTVTQETQV
jgi:amino acid transporter